MIPRGRAGIASCRPLALTLLVLFGSLLVPERSPAAPFNLSRTLSPLPGSNFQGADGDQDDDARYGIDWQSRRNGASVAHGVEPSGSDDRFSAGTEAQPGQWRITTSATSVSPSGADLQDVYYALDQGSGQVFLHAAMARRGTTDPAYAVIELNQVAGTWRNAAGSNVPCRTDGDLLIGLNQPNGTSGTLTAIVQVWHTSTSESNGCASSGTLTEVTDLTANSQMQGAANQTGTITNRLGTGTLATARFAELSVNLSEVIARSAAVPRGCFAYASVWAHTRSGTSASATLIDHVAPRPLYPAACSVTGLKFYDRNGNGVLDPDEPGMPNVTIFADYNGNGVLDADEPSTITDEGGNYKMHDITRPYELREVIPGDEGSYLCTFPNDGTPEGFVRDDAGGLGCGWMLTDPSRTPDALGRTFGNVKLPTLHVRKQVWGGGRPPEDFVLAIDDDIRGHGEVRARLRPGVHTISELGFPPGLTYDPYLSCVAGDQTFFLEPQPQWAVSLHAGDDMTCLLDNVLVESPAIDVLKAAPEAVERGKAIDYDILVHNVGDVPFRPEEIEVSDPVCDDAPELVDDVPTGALQPGETWTYRCRHQTEEPDADCVEGTLGNTAQIRIPSRNIELEASATTTVTCPEPEEPVDPGPPTPEPEPEPEPRPGPTPTPTPEPQPLPTPSPTAEPDAVAPAPAPVDAPGWTFEGQSTPDVVVRGRVAVSALPSRCVVRGARLTVTVSRATTVSVTIDGRRVRRVKPTALSNRYRVSLPIADLAPGRHAVAVRTAFQLGSGTAPATVRRTLRICAKASATTPTRAPKVTG